MIEITSNQILSNALQTQGQEARDAIGNSLGYAESDCFSLIPTVNRTVDEQNSTVSFVVLSKNDEKFALTDIEEFELKDRDAGSKVTPEIYTDDYDSFLIEAAFDCVTGEPTSEHQINRLGHILQAKKHVLDYALLQPEFQNYNPYDLQVVVKIALMWE